jgi:dephospho-CoA kinase
MNDPGLLIGRACMSDDYVLIGITGSIGSGKSTVAEVFEEEGIPVLRADLIAKELMQHDPAMQEAIRATFGPEAYRDGELDRRFLASQIFSDREKLERMNAIVHPRTIAEQGIRARRLIDQGAKVVACEAALIFESGGEGRFDYIVVVDAPPEIRFERAAERDRVSVEEIGRRDAMQIPAKEKVDRADFVIRNDGGIEELRERARFVAMLAKALPPREKLDVLDEGDEEG